MRYRPVLAIEAGVLIALRLLLPLLRGADVTAPSTPHRNNSLRFPQ